MNKAVKSNQINEIIPPPQRKLEVTLTSLTPFGCPNTLTILLSMVSSDINAMKMQI
jgi:hypothetical protein